MKKIAFFALLVVAAAAFGQDFTFRGFPWGTTPETIIAKEGKPESKSDGMLIYRDISVAENTATLFLYFSSPPFGNGLSWGRYIIPVTKIMAESTYSVLLNRLSTLYGTPTKKTKPEITDKYNYWVVSRTLISLTLLVDVKLPGFQATYISIDYHSPESTVNEFGDL